MKKIAFLLAIYIIVSLAFGCAPKRDITRKPYEATPIPTEPASIAANDVTKFCYAYESVAYDLSMTMARAVKTADEIALASTFSECRDLITNLRRAICILNEENGFSSGGNAIVNTDGGLKFNIKVGDRYADGTLEGTVLKYDMYYQSNTVVSVKLLQNDSEVAAGWFCFVNMNEKYYYMEVGEGIKFYSETNSEYQNPMQIMTYDGADEIKISS